MFEELHVACSASPINMLVKVTHRPDLQQFWRNILFMKYNPSWFCSHNFWNTLNVFFIICLYRLILPDPSLFYFYIEFSFLLWPLSLFQLCIFGGKAQLYIMLTIHSQNSRLGRFAPVQSFWLKFPVQNREFAFQLKRTEYVCFGVFCFSHHHGTLVHGNLQAEKEQAKFIKEAETVQALIWWDSTV